MIENGAIGRHVLCALLVGTLILTLSAVVAEAEEAPRDATTARVILELNAQAERALGASGHPTEAPLSQARATVEEYLAQRSGRVTYASASLPFLVVELPSDGARGLTELDAVTALIPDEPVYLFLDESVPRIGADDPKLGEVSLSGAQQAIAILDTGVEANHPFLKERVASEACFSAGDPEDPNPSCPGGVSALIGPGAAAPLNGNSHGTHVAGIAAGSDGPSAAPNGVAPAAEIIAVQVFNPSDSGLVAYTSDLFAGLEWVYEQRNAHAIAAVNLSLGTRQKFQGTCDTEDFGSPVFAAVDQLRSAGVPTVVAAGNGGSTDGMSWPACLSNTVAVGASENLDALAAFSDTNSLTDVAAPGVQVTSSIVGGGFGTTSGTSMAAPHVAGTFALLREADPDATPADLAAAAKTSRFPIHDERSGGQVRGLPRLDLPSAVAKLTDTTPPATTDIPALEASNGDLRASLSWEATTSGSWYRIYRSTGTIPCSSEAIRRTTRTGTSFTDTNLTHGTTYRYCLVTTDPVTGRSAVSNAKEITAQDLTAPSSPALESKGEKRQISVSWSTVSDPTGPVTYRLYRSSTSSCSMNSKRIYTGTSRSFTDTDLEGDRTYWHCATATDGAGNRSSLSATVSATTTRYPHHGFSDVPSTSWYDAPVRWAKAEDITQGKGGPGLYSPRDPVSRAEMATFLWRVAGEPKG